MFKNASVNLYVKKMACTQSSVKHAQMPAGVQADQAFRIFTPPQYILQRSLAEKQTRTNLACP